MFGVVCEVHHEENVEEKSRAFESWTQEIIKITKKLNQVVFVFR